VYGVVTTHVVVGEIEFIGECGGSDLMLRQLIFGSAVSLGNIATHAR